MHFHGPSGIALACLLLPLLPSPLPSGPDMLPGLSLTLQTDAVPQRPAGSRLPATAPTLDEVLARVSTYLADYERNFTAVVAEERYRQVANLSGRYGTGTNVVHRDLRSDYLLVRPPGEEAWIPFRDVFEVDGKPVRDREERLKKLFLESPSTALTDARRIADESARYNVGRVLRTTNVPTLPLIFLEPANRPRFALKRRGEEVVEGVPTWRIGYAETARPTIIRTPTGNDVPASGTFWIDPLSGRIVKTTLNTEVRNPRGFGAWPATGQITVVYRPDDLLGIWVPAEMKESHKIGSETTDCTATYSNFRRFQVTTAETIRLPKPP